jgi:phosphatidylserine/phosphatidylglycerophosphate/cardiolipin synthase-like enzyme
MSSVNFESVGPGKVLGFLRGDLREAKKSLFVVGPWVDDYFAAQVTQVTRHSLAVRVLTRPEGQTDPSFWARMSAAVAAFRGHWPACEARTLESLHAKCVVIDDAVAYCGSVNWYRYSLETSYEVSVRGPVDAIAGLAAQLEELWELATALPPSRVGGLTPTPPTGAETEVIDPVAAAVLAADPKAFVIGKKRR